MILKRPYAFLIRHFKIIHSILLFCFGYLVIKTWNIVSFFGTYIKNKQSVTGVYDLPSTYVSSWMYLILFFVLIICGIIIYLMRYKKKPIMFYLYIVTLDLILCVAYYFLYSFLYGFQYDPPDLRTINIVRDVFRALSVAQIPIIGICFIRTIGFDVKKFDFKRDLLDLGIDETDNEEYEVDLKFDRDTIKEKLNKRLRLFKYFYKENKFIFTGLEVALGVIIVVSVVNFIANKETIYKEGESFVIGNLEIQPVESYKTNTDATGKELNGKNFFVISKIRFTNNSNEDISLDTDDIRLSYSEEQSAVPTTKYNDKLNEFGINYFNQKLKPKEIKDFVFVFEIPNEYYDNSFTLKYLYKLRYEESELKYYYKKVKISAKEFESKITQIDTKSIGEELIFKESVLGNTKIKINDIKIADTFYYNIIRCSSGNCSTKTNAVSAKQSSQFDLTLMRINFNIVFDNEKLGNSYSNTKFISQYGSIRFVIDGKEYNNRLVLTDVTPYTTNEYVFVQVRDKLKDAEKIYLDFTIRDKVYTYVLKDVEKVEEA